MLLSKESWRAIIKPNLSNVTLSFEIFIFFNIHRFTSRPFKRRYRHDSSMSILKEEKVSRMEVDVFIPVYPVSAAVIHIKRDNVNRTSIWPSSLLLNFHFSVLVKTRKKLKWPTRRTARHRFSHHTRSREWKLACTRTHVCTHACQFFGIGCWDWRASVGIEVTGTTTTEPRRRIHDFGGLHGPHALATGCPKKFGPRDAFTSPRASPPFSSSGPLRDSSITVSQSWSLARDSRCSGIVLSKWSSSI